MTTEGIDVHSVGNTLVLHQSALIEAFNLKAAIEYQLKNRKKLSQCLVRLKSGFMHEYSYLDKTELFLLSTVLSAVSAAHELTVSHTNTLTRLYKMDFLHKFTKLS